MFWNSTTSCQLSPTYLMDPRLLHETGHAIIRRKRVDGGPWAYKDIAAGCLPAYVRGISWVTGLCFEQQCQRMAETAECTPTRVTSLRNQQNSGFFHRWTSCPHVSKPASLLRLVLFHTAMCDVHAVVDGQISGQCQRTDCSAWRRYIMYRHHSEMRAPIHIQTENNLWLSHS